MYQCNDVKILAGIGILDEILESLQWSLEFGQNGAIRHLGHQKVSNKCGRGKFSIHQHPPMSNDIH